MTHSNTEKSGSKSVKEGAYVIPVTQELRDRFEELYVRHQKKYRAEGGPLGFNAQLAMYFDITQGSSHSSDAGARQRYIDASSRVLELLHWLTRIKGVSADRVHSAIRMRSEETKSVARRIIVDQARARRKQEARDVSRERELAGV